MKRTFNTGFGKENIESVSDNESSNAIYLKNFGFALDYRVCEARKEMKRFLKGKGLAHATPSSQPRAAEDISIHSGQPKSTSRNPRWPEEHNVVLAELLYEQFVNGNICNGNLRREQWSKLVVVFNRRLGTFYTESSVMIRFKNMKADFRTLYQLTNRSGWGWDEELHIPIATDELWDEIVQVTPKHLRFRRHPFHQYEIFEKICSDNIAVGTGARSNKTTTKPISSEMDDTPQDEDEFLTNNGVAYDFKGFPTSELPDATDHVPPSFEPTVGQTVGSKRSSDEPGQSTRRPRKKGGLDNLNKLLVESNKNAVVFKETVVRSNPYTMTDCLQKLGTVENLTAEALLAVVDSLKENTDNKAILMTWEGGVLHKWIEYIVENHPRFYSSKIWM
ncbi:hypothetical protein M5K25_000923 [Dendrobium thyrsiflorum]|uniref:Myb/SANT-like domain-containing protein n=1 Tax=Dendrobium thyrsiflorum TaxID=117978 RepID=A0ABD0VV09_DENTH